MNTPSPFAFPSTPSAVDPVKARRDEIARQLEETRDAYTAALQTYVQPLIDHAQQLINEDAEWAAGNTPAITPQYSSPTRTGQQTGAPASAAASQAPAASRQATSASADPTPTNPTATKALEFFKRWWQFSLKLILAVLGALALGNVATDFFATHPNNIWFVAAATIFMLGVGAAIGAGLGKLIIWLFTRPSAIAERLRENQASKAVVH